MFDEMVLAPIISLVAALFAVCLASLELKLLFHVFQIVFVTDEGVEKIKLKNFQTVPGLTYEEAL